MPAATRHAVSDLAVRDLAVDRVEVPAVAMDQAVSAPVAQGYLVREWER